QKTLSCGDPKNEGTGEPSYQYANELVPSQPVNSDAATTIAPSSSATPSPPPAGSTYYAKGDIVMVNKGAGTNGGQFMIVYDDKSTLSNSYTLVGHITQGLDVVQAIAQGGATDDTGAAASRGNPNQPLIMQQVLVNDVPAQTPTPTPSASPTS